MKFLSITGPKADIDRVVNTYLSKYEIHLENALTELSTMQNITPYIQINPYKETLKQAEDFTALLPEEKRTTTKRLSLEDAINCVHGLDHTLGQLNQERTELEAKKKDLMEKAQKIEPFQDLHCNLSSILDFHFIKFRFGKMHFSITIINIFLPPHKRIMKPIIMCSFLISTIRIIEHFHQTIRINIVNRIISTISIRVL
jgi:V/A-type H+-transporting ATPase subunit I